MRAEVEKSSSASWSGSEIGRSPARTDANLVRFPGWLRTGFWICCSIAVVAVLRRMVALQKPTSAATVAESGKLDAWFEAHALLTWIHISCALVLVLLLPFVFRLRGTKAGAVHRAFFVMGAITGATALGMSRYAVGGWLERSAVLVFDTLFLISMERALIMQMRGDAERQRVWMIRAVAILLGIATTRPVMGVFFATQRLSHLRPEEFFGIAFWIGFSINTIIIEIWLWSVARKVYAIPCNSPR